MAVRGYNPIPNSFQYDFARDGGAVGFLPLGGTMVMGYTLLRANVHVITTVLGGNISVRGSVDIQMSGTLTPAELLAGTQISFDQINDRPFASADQLFGINIGGVPITQGKFVIMLSGVIITET